MEKDVNLWHQLTELNDAITSLKFELYTTRNRNNTFTSATDSDPGLDEEEIQTKPRSHTVASIIDETRSKHTQCRVKDIEQVSTDKNMDSATEVTNSPSRFLGIFDTFSLKSGFFESSAHRLRNNVFLSGLNSGLMDMVGNLIKPPSPIFNHTQVLPRRKLHRQSNVFGLEDVGSNQLAKNDNRTCIEMEVFLYPETETSLQNSKCNDKEEMLVSLEHVINEPNISKTPEDISTIPIQNKTESANRLENDANSNNTHVELNDSESDSGNQETDGLQEAELSDIPFSFLTFKDGFVSCRIMTPNLEKQIQLKRETEEEPLEFLKCTSGFARFRSGSDSDSLSSSCCTRTNEDESSVSEYDSCDDDVQFMDHCAGFDAEVMDSAMECKSTEINVAREAEFKGQCTKSYKDVKDLCGERNTILDTHTNDDELNFNENVSGDESEAQQLFDGAREITKSAIHRCKGDSLLDNSMDESEDSELMEDTSVIQESGTSVERKADFSPEEINKHAHLLILNEKDNTGQILGNYTDKQCTLANRISSVDSGIGESFDNSD